MPSVRQIQLGKQGITDNFIESLKNQFKSCRNVKISVLKSAGANKEQVKKYAEELMEKLGGGYSLRVIGFTIALKRHRKS